MSEDFFPYPDRKEHDYNNRAHILLSKAYLVIKDLRNLFEEHSQTLTERRHDDEIDKQGIVTDDVPGSVGVCDGKAGH